MWKGTVLSIHIAAEAAVPTQSVSEARVVMGKGIEGDRYFDGRGTWSSHPGNGREITLIESESLEGIEKESAIVLAPGSSRRNVVTRGVPLNHLVDRSFRVGQAVLRGMRLCEPCNHLEGLTQSGVKSALLHRGGLRADVLQEGIIRVGDTVEEV
ncbi:MAG: MOSC domain-containing protein [Terriglobia bacterium]